MKPVLMLILVICAIVGIAVGLTALIYDTLETPVPTMTAQEKISITHDSRPCIKLFRQAGDIKYETRPGYNSAKRIGEMYEAIINRMEEMQIQIDSLKAIR